MMHQTLEPWCIAANSWITRIQQPPGTRTLLIESIRWT